MEACNRRNIFLSLNSNFLTKIVVGAAAKDVKKARRSEREKCS